MPTERQLAMQLKKEIANMKRDQIAKAVETVLHMLHDSQLYRSKLWPKRGFLSGGYRGDEKLDTITIGINIAPEYNYKKVRFNIWGKEARVLKQRKQLVLIFDQAVYEGINFYPEYPEYIDQLVCHYHDGYVMDMLDFTFTMPE